MILSYPESLSTIDQIHSSIDLSFRILDNRDTNYREMYVNDVITICNS